MNAEYLKPGQIIVSDKEVPIKTTLGSCISVFLFCKEKEVGGANHFLLPHQKQLIDNPWNYGEKAIPELIAKMFQRIAPTKHLVAQIIGGSSVSFGSFNVGQSNLDIARKILQECSIPIIFEDTGGGKGRVVQFHPKTNILDIRFLERFPCRNLVPAILPITSQQQQHLQKIFLLAQHHINSIIQSQTKSNLVLELLEAKYCELAYVKNYMSQKEHLPIFCCSYKQEVIGKIALMLDSLELFREKFYTPEHHLMHLNTIINLIIKAIGESFSFITSERLFLPISQFNEKDSQESKPQLVLCTKIKLYNPIMYWLLFIEFNNAKVLFDNEGLC